MNHSSSTIAKIKTKKQVDLGRQVSKLIFEYGGCAFGQRNEKHCPVQLAHSWKTFKHQSDVLIPV